MPGNLELEFWNLETQKYAESGHSLRRIISITMPASGCLKSLLICWS